MASEQDLELLVQVGPGTAMGRLLREYRIPACGSVELVADGPPMRLMLRGEKLIVFRDSSGRVGIMDHRCPHRGASLFFARNVRTREDHIEAAVVAHASTRTGCYREGGLSG